MAIDLTVVIIYLIFITCFGLWVGRNAGKDSSSYFLGGRSFNWVLIGFSLFATNISIGAFVGGSGLAARAGLAQINPELLGGIMLTVSAFIFIPLFIRTKIFTIPQFLELRFNRASKLLFGGLYVCQFTFLMPITMYAASKSILELFRFPETSINIQVVALIIVLTVGVYSVFGGLKAVVVTDFVQVLIMLTGGFAVMFIAFIRIGGIEGIQESVPPGQLELLRPSSDPYFPWTAVFPGQLLHSAFFAFCSIHILQRALGAKDINAAQNGLLLGAFLKVFGIFLFTFPGIIGAQLFPGTAADNLYATMIRELLPVGVSGLVLAGMLAAMMSSQDSGINAISGVVALDVWPVFRPRCTEKEAVLVGKVFAASTLVWGILVAPACGNFPEGIYSMILKISGYMMLPTGTCYLLGRYFRRLNGTGAVVTLTIGLLMNVYYVVTSSIPELNHLLPEFARQMHFYELYPLLVLFLGMILFAVSYMTAPPPPEKLKCLEYGEPDESIRIGIPFYKKFKFWWVVYLAIVFTLYFVF